MKVASDKALDVFQEKAVRILDDAIDQTAAVYEKQFALQRRYAWAMAFCALMFGLAVGYLIGRGI